MINKKTLLKLELDLKKNFSGETASTYFYTINKFLKAHPRAVRYKFTAIEEYFANLKKTVVNGKPYSLGYRKIVLASVKAFYTFLLSENIIKEHPCRALFIEKRNSADKVFSNFLTADEMELLLELPNKRYKRVKNRDVAIVGLLIYQGITSAELINLKVSSVDLDKGILKVKGSGKNKNRSIALGSNQITPLIKYINDDRNKLLKVESDRLFVTMRGVPMSVDSLHAFVSGMSGAFDKEVNPKNIRNSVISFWINKRGISLKDVQSMAGHRYPSSTEKFIKPNTEEQRGAVSELHDSIFSN